MYSDMLMRISQLMVIFNVGHDNQNKRFICGTDRGVLYEEYIGALSDNYSIDRIDNN